MTGLRSFPVVVRDDSAKLLFIHAITQHFDLVPQQLKPDIVSGHKKPRYEDENHLQKPRISVVISQNNILSKTLPIINLREAIPFRTPKKSTPQEKILKWSERSHPKAGFFGRKMVCKVILPGARYSVVNRTENRFASL